MILNLWKIKSSMSSLQFSSSFHQAVFWKSCGCMVSSESSDKGFVGGFWLAIGKCSSCSPECTLWMQNRTHVLDYMSLPCLRHFSDSFGLVSLMSASSGSASRVCVISICFKTTYSAVRQVQVQTRGNSWYPSRHNTMYWETADILILQPLND